MYINCFYILWSWFQLCDNYNLKFFTHFNVFVGNKKKKIGTLLKESNVRQTLALSTCSLVESSHYLLLSHIRNSINILTKSSAVLYPCECVPTKRLDVACQVSIVTQQYPSRKQHHLSLTFSNRVNRHTPIDSTVNRFSWINGQRVMLTFRLGSLVIVGEWLITHR